MNWKCLVLGVASSVSLATGAGAPLGFKAGEEAVGAQSAQCGPHCGTERWAVKTFTDSGHGKVNLQPEQTTVAWFVSQEAPPELPDDARVAPIENQAYSVAGALVGFKAEADRDFHIVIADPENSTETMIVEIPDPECGGVCASQALAEIKQTRQEFVDHCGQPTSKFRRLNRRMNVTVTGIGFFDFLHGQTGVADNGIELHPALKIQFPADTRDCELFSGPNAR